MGALIAALWWQLRGVRAKALDASKSAEGIRATAEATHHEVTDRENGSFRAEFIRFRENLLKQIDDWRRASESRLEALDGRLDQQDSRQEERIARLRNDVLEKMDKAREGSERRLSLLDSRLNQQDKRQDEQFSKLEARIGKLEDAHGELIDQYNMILESRDELRKRLRTHEGDEPAPRC